MHQLVYLSLYIYLFIDMNISWWVCFVTGLSYVLQQPRLGDRIHGQNKGRYCKQELSFLLVELLETNTFLNTMYKYLLAIKVDPTSGVCRMEIQTLKWLYVEKRTLPDVSQKLKCTRCLLTSCCPKDLSKLVGMYTCNRKKIMFRLEKK